MFGGLTDSFMGSVFFYPSSKDMSKTLVAAKRLGLKSKVESQPTKAASKPVKAVKKVTKKK